MNLIITLKLELDRDTAWSFTKEELEYMLEQFMEDVPSAFSLPDPESGDEIEVWVDNSEGYITYED